MRGPVHSQTLVKRGNVLLAASSATTVADELRREESTARSHASSAYTCFVSIRVRRLHAAHPRLPRVHLRFRPQRLQLPLYCRQLCRGLRLPSLPFWRNAAAAVNPLRDLTRIGHRRHLPRLHLYWPGRRGRLEGARLWNLGPLDLCSLHCVRLEAPASRFGSRHHLRLRILLRSMLPLRCAADNGRCVLPIAAGVRL